MRSAVRTVVGVAGRAPWSAGCGSPASRVRARRRPARTAGSGQVGSRPSVARLADLERRVGVLVLAGPLAASGPGVAGSWPAGSWRSGAGPGVDGSGVDGSGVDGSGVGGSGVGGLGCSRGAGGSRDAGSSWGSWGAGAASGRSGGVAGGVGACPAAGRVVGRGRVAGPAGAWRTGAGRAGTWDAGAWPVGAWPADPLAEARVAGVGGPYARVAGARVAGPGVAGARRAEPRVAGSRPVRSWPAGSWRPGARPRVGGTWGARAGTGRHVAWCAGIPAGRAGHAAGITRGVGAELATGRVVRRRRSGCPVGPGSLPWITSAWITRARIADSRIARAGICAAGVCASRACAARVRVPGVRVPGIGVPGIGVPGIGRPGVSHPRAVGSGAGVSWCPGAGVGGSRLAGTGSGIDSPRIARRAGSAVPPAGGARDAGSGFQPGMPLVTSRLIVAAPPAVEPLRPGRAAAASRQVRVGAGAEAPGIVVAMRGWSLIRGDPSRHPGGRQSLIRLRSRTARIGRTAVGGRPELVPRLSVVTVLIAVHRPVWLARAVRSVPTVLVPGIGTAALRVAGVGVGHSGPIPRSGPVHWRSSPGRAEA